MGSAKAALAGAVVGFLSPGFVGNYRCLRDQGLARLAAACGGVCFALANYSTTNWLVRGRIGRVFSGHDVALGAAVCSATLPTPFF